MKIPKIKHQEVIEAYKGGKSLTEVSELYNVSPGSVCYILKKYNVPRRRRGAIKGSHNITNAKIPIGEIDTIIQRYKNTSDILKDIASDYGVTRQAIDELLKRNKVEKRSHTAKQRKCTPIEINMVISMYKDKESIQKIAKEIEMSATRIRAILSENDVPIRSTNKINKYEQGIVVQRYLDGEFMEEIAKDYKVHAATIGGILRKNHVKARKLKKFTPSLYEQVYKALEAGKTHIEVSDKYGIKPSSVAFISKQKNTMEDTDEN